MIFRAGIHFFLAACVLPAGAAAYRVSRAFPKIYFDHPVHLTHPGDGSGRLFVAEKKGVVKVFASGDTAAGVFLDISDKVNAKYEEAGLLSAAFHPRFKENGKFYLYYTYGVLISCVSEFKVSTDPRRAERSSERKLLLLRQRALNHNGGQLAFGPDGFLYVGLGDGGGGEGPPAAQDLRHLFAKILRIDVDRRDSGLAYAVPPGNPFYKNDSGFRGETWAYGLRNPWRFSFDRTTGELWAGDVGENLLEEIDLVFRGKNYGWGFMEGNRCSPRYPACSNAGFIPPVIEYGRTEGLSVTGGFVYRGPSMPEFDGVYLYGDFETRKIWGLRYREGQVLENRLLATAPSRISSFGEDGEGEVYALGYDDGGVYRLEMEKEKKTKEKSAEEGMPKKIKASFFGGESPYSVALTSWNGGFSSVFSRLRSRPGDTLFVQHLSSGKKRVETRILQRDETGWLAFKYVWNNKNTEAASVDHGGKCFTCHTPVSGVVLSLDSLRRSGVAGASGLESRARAYLHANCSHCHRPGGTVLSDMDLRFETPLARTNTVHAEAWRETGFQDAVRLRPGDPRRSLIYLRISTEGEFRMPRNADFPVDTGGSDIIGAWITGIK